jgi:hypothetical protein
MMIEPEFKRSVTLKDWLSVATDINKSTENIVLLDEEKTILYGHALLRDIAEGRTPGQKVRFINDMELDLFLTLSEARYGQKPCVMALQNKKIVSPEDLERISREIVLTDHDLEQLLSVQQRQEALGED